MRRDYLFESEYPFLRQTRHKVFISYYHKGDEYYRNRFEELFGHLFINKSVEPGDIDTDDSAEYVKRLIQEDYITDASVLVVLVGSKTYCRKHVDWETSAALNEKVGGYSGVVGLLLPTYPSYEENKYNPNTIPPRLNDNIKSEYAKLYRWTTDVDKIKRWVEEAFHARIVKADKIKNSRLQFDYNGCE